MSLRSLENIIDSVQRRPSSKASCEEKVKQLITDHGPDLVWEGDDKNKIRGIKHVVNYLLMAKDARDDAVTRISEFISVIANMEDFVVGESQPIFSKLFDKLVPFCYDPCPTKRFRAASMLVQVIKRLKREEFLSDEQFDHLTKLGPSVSVDKVPAIRCEGMRILAKLQDPRDPACIYMNKILFHMAKDPKAEVRRTCVEVIALCSRSLQKIQRRAMDVSASVRRQVYMVYSKRLKLRVLQLTDRTHILTRGLTDRSPHVVQEVKEHLLPNWLEQSDGKLLTLLDNIDPYHKPETTEQVIEILLERARKNETLEKVIDDIMDIHFPNGEIVKDDELTAPYLIVWRELIIYLKKNSDDELCHAFLFKVLPVTASLAQLMVRTVGKTEENMSAMEVVNHRLVCTQLIKLLNQADFSDFAGKNRLNDALKTFLAQPNMEHFFEPLVGLLCTLHSNLSDEVFPQILDVISEIESPFLDATDHANILSRSMCGDDAPMEVDDQPPPPKNAPIRHSEEPIEVIQARVQLTLLREKIEKLAAEQQFMLAQDAKLEMDKVKAIIEDFERIKQEEENGFLSRDKDDEDLEASFEKANDQDKHADAFSKKGPLDELMTSRCLSIVFLALKKATPKRLDTILENFIEQRALQVICSSYASVRAEAVRCLAVGCILNKEFAISKIPIFTHIAKSDVEQIRIEALLAIFDLLLRFGIKAFSNEENTMMSTHLSITDQNSDEALQAIIAFLADFLKLKSERILEVVIEGLCKLMFVGQLVSPRILAHLLSFWFNAKYAKNPNIIHCLSLFFEGYTKVSKQRMDVIREAFFPCIRLFLDANENSTLSSVNIDRVIDTIISLCDVRCFQDHNKSLVENCPSPHDILAEDLLSKMLKDPYANEVRCYVRGLSKLDISPNADHRALIRLSRKLSVKLDSLASKRHLVKFEQNVKKYLTDQATDNVETDPESQEQDIDSDEDVEAPPAHDIALRKQLRKSLEDKVDKLFSDSD